MALGANKFSTLNASGIAAGATSATLSSAAFANGTAVPLVLDYGDSAKLEVITATVTGTALTNIVRGVDGTSDVTHSGGCSVAQGAVPESFKYWWNNKTDANLLGYAEITSAFTTTTTPAFVDVANLAVTFTVPPGGRRVKVTSFLPALKSSGATNTLVAAIRNGSTTLTYAVYDALTGNYRMPINMIYSAVLAAGSYTYKVSVNQSAAGTLAVDAGATQLAFIMAELI